MKNEIIEHKPESNRETQNQKQIILAQSQTNLPFLTKLSAEILIDLVQFSKTIYNERVCTPKMFLF